MLMLMLENKRCTWMGDHQGRLGAIWSWVHPSAWILNCDWSTIITAWDADGRWTDSANQIWYYLGYVKHIYSQNWRYISFPNKCFLVTACILTQNRKCSLILYWRVTYFQRYDCNVEYIFISGANLSIDLRRKTTPAPRQPLNFLWYKPQISLIFAKIADLLRASPPNPHQELFPWTPLGDFCPPDPLMAPPAHKILDTPLVYTFKPISRKHNYK